MAPSGANRFEPMHKGFADLSLPLGYGTEHELKITGFSTLRKESWMAWLMLRTYSHPSVFLQFTEFAFEDLQSKATVLLIPLANGL